MLGTIYIWRDRKNLPKAIATITGRVSASEIIAKRGSAGKLRVSWARWTAGLTASDANARVLIGRSPARRPHRAPRWTLNAGIATVRTTWIHLYPLRICKETGVGSVCITIMLHYSEPGYPRVPGAFHYYYVRPHQSSSIVPFRESCKELNNRSISILIAPEMLEYTKPYSTRDIKQQIQILEAISSTLTASSQTPSLLPPTVCARPHFGH
jgi:hypothetical protein